MNHVMESGKEVFLVTITLEEYRELVTKCARYDLLQEQEAQQKAELEAFKATLVKVPCDTAEKVTSAIHTEVKQRKEKNA